MDEKVAIKDRTMKLKQIKNEIGFNELSGSERSAFFASVLSKMDEKDRINLQAEAEYLVDKIKGRFGRSSLQFTVDGAMELLCAIGVAMVSGVVYVGEQEMKK